MSGGAAAADAVDTRGTLNYSGIPVGSALAGSLVAVSFTLVFGLGVVFALAAAALTYVLGCRRSTPSRKAPGRLPASADRRERASRTS